jgi:signal recognition particle subunit SRP14
MVLLENDPFLTELGKLYARTKTAGTVYITLKRVTELQLTKGKGKKKAAGTAPGGGQTKAEQHADAEPRCLIRATAGSKKISTVVSS